MTELVTSFSPVAYAAIVAAIAAIEIACVALIITYTDGSDDDFTAHEGWEDGHEGELHDLLAAGDDFPDDPEPDDPEPGYLGRHGEDTIQFHRVEADWAPPTGAARLAAASDDTQRIETIQ